MNPAFEKIIRERGWDSPDADWMSSLQDARQIMENIEKRLSRRLPEGEAFALTRFQEKVIGDEQFWRDWESGTVSHLMIQGATSAGKTLVSELAILDTCARDLKAVVLVPLKAMVHERREQFRQDMPNQRVWGSSSDHMEYDERLMHGDYDVAVIVYEKFFAMLNQNPTELMSRCGLLVVDELSMLSKEQRGPKLEMLLEKVRKNYRETRIMCLATCDCKTDKICKWLGIEQPIFSTARPVGLEEHILLMNGEGIYRSIPANHEQENESPEEIQEQVELPQYRNDLPIVIKRKNLMKAVVRKIHTNMQDARLLIFLASQSGVSTIARCLREEMPDLFPQVNTSDPEYREFMERVNACSIDEDPNELLSDLSHGIAYHHAGMSTTLREVIEQELQKPQSFIRTIVATETLTVGVNMPFDAMIILSHKVSRGPGNDVPLTRQEYRNYIGRAGRLGQNNRTGVTYLFVEERREQAHYWRSFSSREEVTSALISADAETLAPYYLGLLPDRFTEQDLDRLFRESLTKACSPSKSISPDELQQALANAYLTGKSNQRVMGALNAGKQQYEVKSFGKFIAPYALSCDTCILIYSYFMEGSIHGGLPANITREDIESDKYLLEILYHICLHPEVAQSSVLPFPAQNNQPEISIRAKKLVLDQLQILLNEKDAQGDGRNVLWCECQPNAPREENDLWCLVNEHNLGGEHNMLQAAMRAILLLYWTRGMTIPEIRKQTQFQNINRKLLGGDIERLAEVVSFHMDAIHKSLAYAHNVFSPEASNAFYALLTRVKYGMPRDLVRFANKHIYGLDRAKLLDLMRDAKSMNLSPVQYLYTAPQSRRSNYLSPTQYTQLLQALERRNSVRQFDMLMEIVAKDAGTRLTDDNRLCLQAIYDWNGTDTVALFDLIEKLLENEAFGRTTVSTWGNDHCITLSKDGRKLRIGLLEQGQDENTANRIRKFFDSEPAAPRLLLVPTRSINDSWDNHDLIQAMNTYHVSTLLNTGFLAMVFANTIAMDLANGKQMFEFLTDIRGIFTENETRFCVLSNYVSHPKADTPRFRLLCSNQISPAVSEMQLALSADKDLQNHEVLSWDSSLMDCDCTDCPAILFLDRAHVTRSQNLNLFLTKMQNERFANCLLLVESEAAEANWNSPEELEDAGCSKWQRQYSGIRKAVVSDGQDAVRAIREFLATWKHNGYLVGISYAHYNPENNRPVNELEALRALARELADEYGEHRILFDEFTPARDLFPVNGVPRSLDAYRQCKISLILWNCWTKENINCQRELEAILDECGKRNAVCMFLNDQQPTDPEIPQGHVHFATCLRDKDGIVRMVREVVSGDISDFLPPGGEASPS